MASLLFHLASKFLLFIFLLHFSSATAGKLHRLGHQDSMKFQYHNGSLLSGKISVSLIWYGDFKPSQRSIISDLISSLSVSPFNTRPKPSVRTWWKTIDKYYNLTSMKLHPLSLQMGKQILDENYSLGKSLTQKQILQLAAMGNKKNAINVVLTAADVTFQNFCLHTCGTHVSQDKKSQLTYIWVGNSEKQCPGKCAWPFHQPIYGPQNPPLVSPDNDVGVDGMVINLAGLLAGTATNPFGNGYYQGPAEAPLEAASACTGIFGRGSYPGYAGKLLVDSTTGASYNSYGVNRRKFLLPALFDPSTSSCSTLV
ncbi:hypothetical protein NE237_024603 [Protea cynaroides]|uniref:Uncharacterized protein n=1 Tax=Protea cynaroides TaxID=273540 RepID=A0A9Q0H4J9_9MAGN|nr:hypothetical protein NE237_024603 [Protea cynaroides]